MVKIDSVQDVKELLKGNHASQNVIQVGYDGEVEEKITRKIGDRWMDSDGNEWEQKEGDSIKLGKDWQQELHGYLTTIANCRKGTCSCNLPRRIDDKMRMSHDM